MAPVVGGRFSRNWLKGLSEWVSFFRTAKLLRAPSKLISCYGVEIQAQKTMNKVDHSPNVGEGVSSTRTEIKLKTPVLKEDAVNCSESDSTQHLKLRALSQRALMTAINPDAVHGVSLSVPRPNISDIAPLLCDQRNDNETILAVSDVTFATSHQRKFENSTIKQCKQPGVVSISIRCEKMDMTDNEVEMLAVWLQEHKECVNCTKLWLFDNKLTDQSAGSITRMMHDGKLTGASNVVHIPLFLFTVWKREFQDILKSFLPFEFQFRIVVAIYKGYVVGQFSNFTDFSGN